MKNKINNKKIGFFSIVIIILLILIALGYIYFNPNRNISSNGFSFSYPKKLSIENLGISSSKNYILYRIYDKSFPGVIGSNIQISIPIKNSDSQKKLSEDIRSEFKTFILPITINNHKGEFVTYHLNEQLPGDRPVQVQNTEIYLNSSFENSPILLNYVNYDGGNSLDNAWELILKTLKYDDGL